MDMETQTIYRADAADDSTTEVINIPSQSLPADRAGEAAVPCLPQAVVLPSSGSPEAPFIAELLRRDVGPGGTFRPAARLVLTPALRTGGLWHVLPAEELRTLVLMLTFLTDNGWCRPSLIELAQAMQVPEYKARNRMARLTGVSWQGNPVIHEQARENGLHAFMPSRAVLAVTEARAVPAEADEAPIRPAGRQAVTEYSRARYGRPRAEVEADIARRMGWGPPAFEDEAPQIAEEKRALYGQLSGHGMTKAQALDVLGRFDLGRVRRQVSWMPHRGAKTPARYLMAAIENDYDPPVAARIRQASSGEAEGTQADS